VEVYDLNNNQITGAAFMGTVGLNWQFLRHLGSSQASVFSSKKIFKFGVIESKMLTSVERGANNAVAGGGKGDSHAM
jgi:hypothetical protein